MLLKPLGAVLVLAFVSCASSSNPVDTMVPRANDERCCAFVRASLNIQKELAMKVQRYNGRKVYMFDKTNFTANFVDEKTVDHIRYKTGLVGNAMVDAVLSGSAQRALANSGDGAETFLDWLRPDEDAKLDAIGVHI